MFCTYTKPNFNQPWSMKPQNRCTASGFIVAGRKILTNAHAVAYHTSVQVRKQGSADKVTARVVAIAHDCDIAVLTGAFAHETGDARGLATFVSGRAFASSGARLARGWLRQFADQLISVLLRLSASPSMNS